MSSEILLGPAKTISLLHRADADGAIANAASETTGKQRLTGLARIRGTLQSDQAPATGYPRVRQSHDGTSWDLVTGGEVFRDLSQGGYTYSFDLAIQRDYVMVEWTQGGTQGTYLRADVKAVAGIFGAPDIAAGAAGGKLQFINSDKDSHFTGGTAANNHEFANITGLSSNAGRIKGVTFTSEDHLDWELHFWRNDGADDADLDADAWLGSISLPAASASQIVGATVTTYRYSVEANMPYFDEDGTNELHVSLVPRSGAKTAGSSGEVRLTVAFVPE